MDIDYNWIRISKNILIIITFLKFNNIFFNFQLNNLIDLFIINTYTKKYKKEKMIRLDHLVIKIN